MYNRKYYLVNSLTFYRLLSAPVLMVLIFYDELSLFRYLLAVSFLTDALDGFLARKLNAMSAFGAKMDSIADDLTILAAIGGMIKFKPDIILDQVFLISLVFSLFCIQTAMALFRYRKISSFHTYLAKAAAVMQALFFISLFFAPRPVYVLFYPAVFLTALDLVEEIILVVILPKWEVNVKGLYWIMKKRRTDDNYQAGP